MRVLDESGKRAAGADEMQTRPSVQPLFGILRDEPRRFFFEG